MYTETVEYWDDLVPESWKIALPEYKLTLVSSEKKDDATTLLTVSSAVPEHLKEFLDDLDEGDLRPFDVISRNCKSDDVYIDTLQKMINSIR